MLFKKIAIVGCGLIGGSLAKKISQENKDLMLIGVSSKAEQLKNDAESSCFSSLIKDVSDLDSDCDLVIVCVPIEHTVSSMKRVSEVVHEKCIITDVASIKERIATELSKESIKQPVILGHPMAGKESTGFDVSEAALFDGAPYFLINDGSDAYTKLVSFLKSLTLNVIETTAQEHDLVVSLSSHLPYLMACATVSALKDKSDAVLETVKKSYGPGFRDTTRVAGSDPKWGRAVCEDNAKNLSEHLAVIIESLQTLKNNIDSKKFIEIETDLQHSQSLKSKLTRP